MPNEEKINNDPYENDPIRKKARELYGVGSIFNEEKRGFIKGAEWMQRELKSKWHDSNTEQPDGKRLVVAYSPEIQHGEIRRFTYINANHLWAYLDDLMPQKNPSANP